MGVNWGAVDAYDAQNRNKWAGAFIHSAEADSLALKSLYILISYDSLLKQKHLYVFPFCIDAALMNRDYCLSPSKAQILNTHWCVGLFFFSLSFIPAAA